MYDIVLNGLVRDQENVVSEVFFLSSSYILVGYSVALNHMKSAKYYVKENMVLQVFRWVKERLSNNFI